MNASENDGLDKEFVRAWRRWAEKPPQQSPSQAAAKIALRIRNRPPRHKPNWFLAAAAAILLAAVGATVLWKPLQTSAPPPGSSAIEIQPLGKGEVLLWIDEQTPLYMTFQAPEDQQGKGDKL